VQRSLRAAAALVLAVVAGFAAPEPSQASHGTVVAVHSKALDGTLHIRVVLPAGYSTAERYPVVYFLHGLPAGSTSFLGNDWVTDALEQVGPAILVFPQAARDDDTDPEYLNWGVGRGWETFVAEELPHFVDTHYSTIADRTGRAIVGVSAGGYGATVLGLHHLGTYSVIESWSGYFHPTDPTGLRALARGPATSAHTLITKLKTTKTFFGFYVGRSDTRFRDENVQLNRELTAAKVPHVFAVYPGGHQTSLWESHATAWLTMALNRLAPAS
jgi:enterochelin esterase-like enzyme